MSSNPSAPATLSETEAPAASASARRVPRSVVRAVSALMWLFSIAAGVFLGLVWRTYRQDPLAEERRIVLALTPEAKNELREKAERFAKLAPQEQERLRALRHALATDPAAEELQAVMQRYYHWLSDLKATEREELLALQGDVTARIAKANAIAQERERRAPLSAEDRVALFMWRVDMLKARVPADRRQELEQLIRNKPQDWQWRMLRLLPTPDPKLGPFDRSWLHDVQEDEIRQLANSLSEKARQTLDKEPTLADKRKLIFERWLPTLFQRRFPAMEVNKEELARFFETELSKEIREQLLQLSEEERNRRLRFLYFQMRDGGGRPPRGQRPGTPPGPPADSGVPGDRPKT